MSKAGVDDKKSERRTPFFRVMRECRKQDESEKKKSPPRLKSSPRVTLVRDCVVTPKQRERPCRIRPMPFKKTKTTTTTSENLPQANCGMRQQPKVVSAASSSKFVHKSLSTPELNSVYNLCGKMTDLKRDLDQKSGPKKRLELARMRLRSSPRTEARLEAKSLARGLNFTHEKVLFDENGLVPLDFDPEKLFRKRSKSSKLKKKRNSLPGKYLERSFHPEDYDVEMPDDENFK